MKIGCAKPVCSIRPWSAAIGRSISTAIATGNTCSGTCSCWKPGVSAGPDEFMSGGSGRPDADGAPKRLALRKPHVGKTGAPEHVLDLVSGKTLFQARAETIVGVGAHHIKCLVGVIGQRQRARRQTEPRQEPRDAC